MSAMSNYIRVRHNLHPDTVVEIPLAWLDTSLADAYTLEDAPVVPEPEPEQPKEVKRRGRKKITEDNPGEFENEFVEDILVNDEDEETNE